MRLALASLFRTVAAVLHRLGLQRLNKLGARLLLGVKPLSIEAHGLHLQGSPQAWNMLREIKEGTYDPYLLSVYQSTLQPGMTVVDVGANIGLFTLIAAKTVSHVIAIEPDPRNLHDLRANIAANQLTNVTVVEAAASDTASVADLYLRHVPGHSGLYADPEPYVEVQQVATVTLDELVERVDVLKIDAEGAEYAILRGAERLLAGRPQCFLEYAPGDLEAAGSSGAQLLELLHARFGAVLLVDETQQRLQPLAEPVRMSGRFVNVYCQP